MIFRRLPAELVFVCTFFISGCLSRRNNVDDFLFWGAAVYEYDQQQYQPSARTDSLIALLTFLLDEVVFGDDMIWVLEHLRCHFKRDAVNPEIAVRLLRASTCILVYDSIVYTKQYVYQLMPPAW